MYKNTLNLLLKKPNPTPKLRLACLYFFHSINLFQKMLCPTIWVILGNLRMWHLLPWRQFQSFIGLEQYFVQRKVEVSVWRETLLTSDYLSWDKDILLWINSENCQKVYRPKSTIPNNLIKIEENLLRQCAKHVYAKLGDNGIPS